MKKTTTVFLSTLVLFAMQYPSFCQEYSSAQLPTTIIRDIKSDIVEDMVYELIIDLPPSYQTTEKTYPVVYLLDAYETFGLMLQTYQQLIFMNKIPAM